MKQELEENGYIILRNVIDDRFLHYLRIFTDIALKDAKDGFVAHSIVKTPEFVNYLGYLKEEGVLDKIEKDYFNSKFIINSFSCLNNLPNQTNFSANIHRDIRFFSGSCNLMLNTLLMLDNFTISNGATCIFPKSHKEKEFIHGVWGKNGIQLEGKAGDIAIWNSNLYHCSMPNTTKEGRRALICVYQKSAMKQLLDYPEAMKDKMSGFSEDIQQLLGNNSIVAKSLEEWNGIRTYKKEQD